MICVSQLTGQWYLVTRWNKDGSARHKIEITGEMRRIKRDLIEEFEMLDAANAPALAAKKNGARK